MQNKTGFLVMILSMSLLFGCANAPKFEKSTGASGYSAKELTNKQHLEVTLALPAETPKKTLERYAWRAIGEECLSRGFEYFDISEETPMKYIGFCYPTDVKKALALTFHDSGLQQQPRKFVVSDVNNKPATKLQINDELLSMGGQSLTSMGQIKSLLFVATRTSDTIPVTFVRNGQNLKVDEPVTLVKSQVFGKTDLEQLRSAVK